MLSLSASVLSVSGALAPALQCAASDSSAAPAATLHASPRWFQRMAWSLGDAVIVARRTDAQDTAADDVQLSCTLARVQPLDPTLHGLAWHSLALPSAAAVEFGATCSAAEWKRRVETHLKEEREEEEAHRRARAAGREAAAAASAASVAAASSAAASAAMKTPVKAAKVIMQPPSARSLAAAEASASVGPSMQESLAASARISVRLQPDWMPPKPSDSKATPSVEPALHILSPRAARIPPATRLLLRPLDAIEAPSPTAEQSAELAASLRRTLHRCYLIAGAVVSIESRRWRVAEAQPSAEVVEVARGTALVIDWTQQPEPTVNTTVPPAALSPLPSLGSPSPTAAPLPPALRALHALLAPSLLNPALFATLGIDPPRGLLLSGPPGVGKTYAVRLACSQMNVALFVLDAAQVHTSNSAGGAEEELRRAFAQARDAAPSVLFLDEIDALAPARSASSSSGGSSDRVVAQLLSLLDGLSSRGNVVVVGATNRPNALDAALRRPGRFDRELRVEPPTPQERGDILQFYTRTMPLTPDALHGLPDMMVGFVGADIASLCREAALGAMKRYTAAMRAMTGGGASQPTAAAVALPTEVTRADFLHALALVPASSLRPGGGALQSKPQGDWDSVGGLSDVKRALRQAVEWPLLHSATFLRLGLTPPRGILLYGPPGCAKTTLVRLVAAQSHAGFLTLDAASLYSCFVGEAERVLRQVFARARANRPCVLFLDEIDAMVGARDLTGGASSGGAGGALEARILSTLLNEMDGVSSSEGLLVVAATNRIDMIDDALLRPGRFDRIIYVPPPDASSRVEILRVHARSMLADPDSPGTVAALSELALTLDLYTGADLANLCREAALTVLRTNMQQEKVTVDDLRRAAANSTPSLTHELVKHYAATSKRQKE